MKYFFSFLMIFTIISCSGVKDNSSKIPQNYIPKQNSELKSLQVKGKLIANTPERSGSLSTQIKVAGRDSLFMRILAPFGFEVARLYSTNEEFKFYNVFQNEAFKGVPSSENLKKVSDMELSFQDLIKISRSEVPGNSKNYILKTKFEDESKEFVSTINNQIKEKIKLNALGTILEYHQYGDDGEELMNVNFSDYKDVNGFYMAHTIKMVFKEIKSEFTIKAEEILVNTLDNTPMSFTLPKNTSVKILE